MAYFNNTNNTNFYPAPSASGELEAHPLPSHTSAAEDNNQMYDTSVDQWNMIRQSGPVVGSRTNLRATAGYESVVSAIPYASPASGYDQQPHPGNNWSAVSQWPQHHHSSFPSQGGPFVNVIASERSTGVQIPISSVPFDYWGGNQSGPSRSKFRSENVHTPYQHSAGPARTGLMPIGRFQPYGISRICPRECRDAEAGLSTLMAPQGPYVDLQMLQPSGGISETTADAVMTQITTEEDETPTPQRTRLPRGQGKPRGHRLRKRKIARKLCDWVQWQRKSQAAPSFNEALAVAVEIIPTIRSPVYLEPCLLITPTAQGKRTAEGSKDADDEYERRNVERKLFQELSRYYPLGGQPVWSCPKLLLNVWTDLENLPAPSESSNKSPP